MGKRPTVLAVAVLWLLSAASLSAQTVINPRTVEFTPSADHGAVGTSGQPLVLRYQLAIYSATTGQLQQTVDLGKPAPGSDGLIRVEFAALLPTWPLPNGVYDARVSAVGAAGSGLSDPSNQFAFQSCTYIVSPLTRSIGVAGGSTSVSVTADPGCTWTATSNASWIAVSPVSASGSSGVTLTVSANSLTTMRTGTVTIAGQTVTVSQDSVACPYSLSSNSQAFTAAGGSGTVTLTALTGCSWTAASSASWVTVTPVSGSGTGTVSFTAAANPTTTARTATLTIGGQPFTVTQAADATCSYTLSGNYLRLGSAGGSAMVGITSSTGCAWNSVSNAAWISVSPSSGSGAGSVMVTVAANDTSASRGSTVTIAGTVVTVSQDTKTGPQSPKGLRVVPKKK